VANLTFSDLTNEVFAHLGLDSTDSANSANVTRWLNYTQQDICARWPWKFMEGRETVVTIPDYTTGTVSINSGSPTVTGSGTSWTTGISTAKDCFIQFNNSNDWYHITTRTSDTSITLDINYAQTANLVNVTYIVRQFYYTLSTSADRIIDVKNWQTPIRLVQVDTRTLDDIRPNPQSTNSSYGYIAYGYDSTGAMVISPYPFPSDSRLLEIHTMIRPVDGSISLPNKYAHIIAWGAISIGYRFLRKFKEADEWERMFEKRIAEMKIEYKMTEDYAPGFRSIDSIQRSKWLQMPENYPVITS
jgi:hypothetical protein